MSTIDDRGTSMSDKLLTTPEVNFLVLQYLTSRLSGDVLTVVEQQLSTSLPPRYDWTGTPNALPLNDLVCVSLFYAHCKRGTSSNGCLQIIYLLCLKS